METTRPLIAGTKKYQSEAVTYKMTTDIPASILTPDVVETSLGTLRFFDGLPDTATAQKVFDNLDRQRGVEVFLTAMPAASAHAFRTGLRTFGPDNQTVPISESLMDSRGLYLTSNTETVYSISPSCFEKMIGQLSQYAITERDATGRYLDGAKSYRLHHPTNKPLSSTS